VTRAGLGRRITWGLVLGGGASALLLWILTIPPLLPSYARTVAAWKPSESWLYDRNGQLLDSLRVDFHARRLAWVKSDAIAPFVTQTIIKAEDKRFNDHGGIDWLAIASAIRSRFDGSQSRGASTISMQVAAFLAPELAQPGNRSWLDKLKQMRAASALEGNWSKEQILEAYVNLAGFRGEAQGIGAASLSLFGKAPDVLTREEAVLIAALLPSPSASADQIGKRACRIAPDLPCSALQNAALAMTGRDRQLALDPGLAPHLAVKLLTKPGVRVTTTLEARVQLLATSALRQQLIGLGKARARDGAVIVLDNATGDILAYVGGVGGDSTAAAVDGADAPRQAGSTLKPFLYAQAMEGGYITPASILDDSPVQLDTASGLYVPQNYDKGFKGPVSARTALASSLNVPAVRALMLIGPEAFRDRLWDSGYRGLTEDGQYYGFSLALGSAEVTLVEQAEAYRSLALGGRWSSARVKSSDPRSAPRTTVSAEAAWLVSDIMADPQARSTTFGMDSALKLPFWAAVKTGTSKAMRDNWCVGYTDRYTVAVWIGNLEGDSMQAVSGTSGAAPVWRDIMMALHRAVPGRAPAMPSGIEMRQIRFAAGVESPRREYFLSGTGQAEQLAAPAQSRRPRITNPVSGAVFALDPDIPLDRQRIGIMVSGSTDGHRLLLDKQDLGPADAKPQLLIRPGSHLLALADSGGKVIDQVRFTMR
jgi:penicillin-binding protein 1C